MPGLCPEPPRSRSRIRLAVIAAGVIACGLGARHAAARLPSVVATYAPDTLWAALVYVLLGMIFPRARSVFLSASALLFSFGIEISQMYHAPWIDGIRATRLGGLVLGYGFLWSDLLCYSAGVALAAAIDAVSQRRWPQAK